MAASRRYGDACGVARSLNAIGERWSLLVVRELLLGPKRFNDLLGGLAGMSPNVLSQRLRELTDAGVVRRRDLGAPARVRLYELTPWGQRLEPVLLYLGRWGAESPHPVDGELSVDSLMLGVKAVYEPGGPGGAPAAYAVVVSDDRFLMRLTGDDTLTIRRVASGYIDAAHVDAAHVDTAHVDTAHVDATLTTDRRTFSDVCTGIRSASAARADGDLVLEGEEPSVRALLRLLTAPWRAA